MIMNKNKILSSNLKNKKIIINNTFSICGLKLIEEAYDIYF